MRLRCGIHGPVRPSKKSSPVGVFHRRRPQCHHLCCDPGKHAKERGVCKKSRVWRKRVDTPTPSPPDILGQGLRPRTWAGHSGARQRAGSEASHAGVQGGHFVRKSLRARQCHRCPVMKQLWCGLRQIWDGSLALPASSCVTSGKWFNLSGLQCLHLHGAGAGKRPAKSQGSQCFRHRLSVTRTALPRSQESSRRRHFMCDYVPIKLIYKKQARTRPQLPAPGKGCLHLSLRVAEGLNGKQHGEILGQQLLPEIL